jgi:MYXO-CTERM domain-containing protein
MMDDFHVINLRCPACGAPNPGAAAGGAVTCAYCHTTFSVHSTAHVAAKLQSAPPTPSEPVNAARRAAASESRDDLLQQQRQRELQNLRRRRARLAARLENLEHTGVSSRWFPFIRLVGLVWIVFVLLIWVGFVAQGEDSAPPCILGFFLIAGLGLVFARRRRPQAEVELLRKRLQEMDEAIRRAE